MASTATPTGSSGRSSSGGGKLIRVAITLLILAALGFSVYGFATGTNPFTGITEWFTIPNILIGIAILAYLHGGWSARKDDATYAKKLFYFLTGLFVLVGLAIGGLRLYLEEDGFNAFTKVADAKRDAQVKPLIEKADGLSGDTKVEDIDLADLLLPDVNFLPDWWSWGYAAIGVLVLLILFGLFWTKEGRESLGKVAMPLALVAIAVIVWNVWGSNSRPDNRHVERLPAVVVESIPTKVRVPKCLNDNYWSAEIDVPSGWLITTGWGFDKVRIQGRTAAGWIDLRPGNVGASYDAFRYCTESAVYANHNMTLEPKRINS